MLVTALSSLVLSSPPAVPARPQQARPVEKIELRPRELPPPPPLWYSGDTHEHVQYCDGTVHGLEEILARMKAEDQDVANVLVWSAPGLPFTWFACRVTGEPDPLSLPDHILQYGVETSGLDCSKWGHLVGLGIGPEQARIAQGSLAVGDCDDMPGLGLGCPGGDGTGLLNAPVAEHFATAPGAVTGYAHTVWSLGLYHPGGFDWNAELLQTGFTTDSVCLDPAQELAVPNLERLLHADEPTLLRVLDHGLAVRAFFPLLGAMDAVLGHAQYFETVALGPTLPVPTTPPAQWTGMYYKLLSAGVRVGLAAGSDRACPTPALTDHPRMAVLLDGPLEYGAWIEGLARGRTTVGLDHLLLDLRVDGQSVGSDVPVSAFDPTAEVSVRLESCTALSDCVELVVDGEVVAALPVELDHGGVRTLDFGAVPFAESAWVAARLCSQDAHTAAVYVIRDGQPITDCLAAEYWMVWCDIVTKRALEPKAALFGCQEGEALARIEEARRAFKAHRDLLGFDPAWQVARFGRSTAACRGPIGIGITGPVVGGAPFRLTCVNGPPSAQGVALVSRAPDLSEPCDGGAARLVSLAPGDLIGTFPASTTRSGYAEVVIPSVPPGAGTVFAQFLWDNPAGCTGARCEPGPAARSASDALQALVQ